jgi:hypothetical protein
MTCRYRFISAHAKQYKIQRLCRVLGVHRSGYTTWVAGAEARARREALDARLEGQIRAAHAASRGTYGVRRIHAELAEQNDDAETELSRLTITRETALALGYTEEAETQPDPVIAQPAYRQILVALEHADGGLRAGDLCRLLDAGNEPKHREGMRHRLKRLADRGILTEAEPGLFTMARTSANH